MISENICQEYDFIVALCDDEKEVVDELTGIVDEVLQKSNRKYTIVKFYSGDELLKEVEKFDLVFLDVDMPGKDGLTTGSEIRALKSECKIIMATGREDCYKDAFKIQALRYVTKPFEKKEVEEAIQAFLNTLCGDSFIEAFYNRTPYRVKQKQIQYIRAMDSYSEIIVPNRILRTEKSMAKLEEELDSNLFFRIHKQYIVNMAAIEKQKKDSVIIQNTELSISRRKRTEFEMKYLEYDLMYR